MHLLVDNESIFAVWNSQISFRYVCAYLRQFVNVSSANEF